LAAFEEKMKREGLAPIVIDTFAHYYKKVVTGETGMISDAEIQPVDPASVPRLEDLSKFSESGRKVLDQTVRIILNGGLGTSMGLTGPKSLLEVREGRTFLHILVEQASRFDVTLALMNSFSTHEETRAALEAMGPERMPLSFLQHKFPKILQSDLSPAQWPEDPELEWNPPGHGDLYTALETSGMLDKLLDRGVRYAFISNSDNLGARLDLSLLGHFAEGGYPFMMEVAERTPADVKGGHLARYSDGRLVLRESAQCPEDELDAFRDIERYHFFNTNNLWVNLGYLKQLIQESGKVRLPMIVNPKTLDPRDESSPPVYQVETAMGAAVSLFEGAAAVCVPRARFFPVKKCSDLLPVRSDYFIYSKETGFALNPDRATDWLDISLDDRYFKKVDQFDARFPEGVPSLVAAESLTVKGDVKFGRDVRVKGDAKVVNPADEQRTVSDGATLSGEITL
jgi:UTP--glucose-1-phosphate uridylyltransferase